MANACSPPHAGTFDHYQMSWKVHSHRQCGGCAESRYHPVAKGMFHETSVLRVHSGMVIRYTSEEASLQRSEASLIGNVTKLRIHLRRRPVGARQVRCKFLCVSLGMTKHDGRSPIGELAEDGRNLLAHPLVEEILVPSGVALPRHMDRQRYGAIRGVKGIRLIGFDKSCDISNVGQGR